MTRDERREVAENLRNMCFCGCRYKEEFYDLLVETVMRTWDFHEFSDVADRLADLMEPEPEERTCHNLGTYGGFECSMCGFKEKQLSEMECEPQDWCFCPNCGAKVVDDDA